MADNRILTENGPAVSGIAGRLPKRATGTILASPVMRTAPAPFANASETRMEHKYSAPLATVFGHLTDPKWLEARCLALGELSAKVKVKKSGKAVKVSMTRRVKRDLPSLIARVLPSESDLQFEESWTPEGDGYKGTLTMDVVGQPVSMTAEFSLEPAGKGCVYRIVHHAKCSIPLVGGPVARYSQGEIEKGCEDELKYLAGSLKKGK
jgi:hypothetical protein